MKTYARSLLALAISSFAVGAFAQSEQSGFPISTDRSSFSDAATLVPVGRWQIEMGGTYFKVGKLDFGQLPELELRYPLNDRFELRLLNFDYTIFEGGHFSQFQDPAISVKIRLSKLNRKPVGEPDIALIANVGVPAGGPGLRADAIQPAIKLAAFYPFTATDGIGGVVSISDYEPKDAPFTQYAAGIYWSHTFNSRLSSFLETYGYTPLANDGGKAALADGGFLYLLNKATQVDIRYGSGFNQGRDGQQFGIGIAFRF